MISSVPEGRAELAATIPLGRFGAPSKMSTAVCFLSSAEPDITGAILPVDGGTSI